MKKALYFVLFMSVGMVGYSQENDKPDGSRLEALKIAYLTRKLNLSPDEAKRFWPIYNNYSAEMRDGRRSRRQGGKSEIEGEERILNIRKKYNAEFSSALSQDKADAFFRAEKEFWNSVKKELSERKERRNAPSN